MSLIKEPNRRFYEKSYFGDIFRNFRISIKALRTPRDVIELTKEFIQLEQAFFGIDKGDYEKFMEREDKTHFITALIFIWGHLNNKRQYMNFDKEFCDSISFLIHKIILFSINCKAP